MSPKLGDYSIFDCVPCEICGARGYHRHYLKKVRKYEKLDCGVCNGAGLVPQNDAKPIKKELEKSAVV